MSNRELRRLRRDLRELTAAIDRLRAPYAGAAGYPYGGLNQANPYHYPDYFRQGNLQNPYGSWRG